MTTAVKRAWSVATSLADATAAVGVAAVAAALCGDVDGAPSTRLHYYVAALQNLTIPAPVARNMFTPVANLPFVTPLPLHASAISARHGSLVEPQSILLSRDLRHMMKTCSISDEPTGPVHSYPPPAW